MATGRVRKVPEEMRHRFGPKLGVVGQERFMPRLGNVTSDFSPRQVVEDLAGLLWRNSAILRAVQKQHRATNRAGVVGRIVSETVKAQLHAAPKDEQLRGGERRQPHRAEIDSLPSKAGDQTDIRRSRQTARLHKRRSPAGWPRCPSIGRTESGRAGRLAAAQSTASATSSASRGRRRSK